MSSLIFASIAIGSVFIGVGLTTVLLRDDLSQHAIWVVRVIVALGAGFVSAGILGTIEVGGDALGIAIKAGGPVALTVLIYLLNPIGGAARTYLRHG